MSLPDIKLNLTDQDIKNLSDLLNPNTENKMATIQAAKEIAHTLRSFSGRSEHLEFFINTIDKFYDRYFTNTQDESLKEFVIATIYSKITEEAGNHLLCHPELTTWPLIKFELRQKFGDKINRHTLTQQLNFLTRNKNESVLEFLDRLKILKNRIALKINSENLIQATKTALIEQTEKTAITVLLANINSELRTILLINDLQDLDDTYNIILNYSIVEQQINSRAQSIRNNSQIHPTQNMQKHRSNNMPNHNNFNNFTNSYPPVQNNFFRQRPQNFNTFPSQPINVQPRPVQHRFPTNQEVFGKPNNAFPKNNPNRSFDNPKPMSGVSVQSKRNFQNFQRTPAQNQNNSHNFRQNQWRQNPHANPLVFTEVTHLENNEQYFSDEIYTEQFQDNTDYTDHHEQNNEYDHYTRQNPEIFPSDYEPTNTYEFDHHDTETSENFHEIASQKVNPS